MHIDEEHLLDIENTVYALDSSTIDLCLSVFPWAHFRKTKSAVKLHTLLDLQGNIPAFLHISDGKLHDVNVLDMLVPEAGAFYIMDRAYLDFSRLFGLHQASAFFVLRSKTRFRRLYSHPIDRTSGLICDQTIKLAGIKTAASYPNVLRRIKYRDRDRDKTLVFLTNNFTLPAFTIAELYRSRWQVELFFKWIKQHLRIKTFFGTSENAVKSQIWIAVSVYVLIAIIRKRLQLEPSLYTILQILSLTVFEKTPLNQLLGSEPDSFLRPPPDNQLRHHPFPSPRPCRRSAGNNREAWPRQADRSEAVTEKEPGAGHDCGEDPGARLEARHGTGPRRGHGGKHSGRDPRSR